MKKTIILIIVVGLIVLAFAYNFSTKNEKVEQKTDKYSKQILKIGDVALNIEIADTKAKREQGLSGREGLMENEGMLFVFETEGYYGFWMKDMKFPIDIVWLDKNKKIIYIEKNVSPETYPKVFIAKKADLPILSLYVLETSAEFLVKNNIKIGDFVAF